MQDPQASTPRPYGKTEGRRPGRVPGLQLSLTCPPSERQLTAPTHAATGDAQRPRSRVFITPRLPSHCPLAIRHLRWRPCSVVRVTSTGRHPEHGYHQLARPGASLGRVECGSLGDARSVLHPALSLFEDAGTWRPCGQRLTWPPGCGAAAPARPEMRAIRQPGIIPVREVGRMWLTVPRGHSETRFLAGCGITLPQRSRRPPTPIVNTVREQPSGARV